MTDEAKPPKKTGESTAATAQAGDRRGQEPAQAGRQGRSSRRRRRSRKPSADPIPKARRLPPRTRPRRRSSARTRPPRRSSRPPTRPTEVLSTDTAATQVMAAGAAQRRLPARRTRPSHAPSRRPAAATRRTTLWVVLAVAAVAVVAARSRLGSSSCATAASSSSAAGRRSAAREAGSSSRRRTTTSRSPCTVADLELTGTYPATHDGDTLTFRFTDTQTQLGEIEATLTYEEDRDVLVLQLSAMGQEGTTHGVRDGRRPRGREPEPDAQPDADRQPHADGEPHGFADRLAVPDAVPHRDEHGPVRPAGRRRDRRRSRSGCSTGRPRTAASPRRKR